MATPLFFAACSDDEPENNGDAQKVTPKDEPQGYCDTLRGWKVNTRSLTAVPLELTNKEQMAIDKSNQFANKLLAKLIKKDTNIVVSPISLQILFGMIMNGQDANAMNEAKNVLGLGDLSLEDINTLFNKVSTSLNSNLDTTSYFETQNAIWSDNLLFKKKYVQTVEDKYSATIANLDFHAPGSADTINAWCEAATKGMINRLITPEELNDLSGVMANACYFKANWQGEFTGMYNGRFYDAQGNVVKDNAYMMSNSNFAKLYEETDSYELVRLPYGNGSFYMDVVLPKNANDNQFLQTFDWSKVNPTTFNKSIHGIPLSLNLSMPRFKANNHHGLIEIMEELGMKRIQEPLTEMNEKLFITALGQLAKIEVDEKGTKAAAVSYALLLTTGEHYDYDLYFNRPFYYAIREAKTGLILFVGNVVVPDDYVEPIDDWR